jgi:hypothetical protein
MKKVLLVLALSASLSAMASPLTGDNFSNNDLQSRSSSSSQAYAGPSTSTGADADFSFLALPSTTSATATSGNVAKDCPLITVKSKGVQALFGLYSDSEIAEQPAEVNGVCVFFHIATTSGRAEDWQRFLNYSASVNPSIKAFLEADAKVIRPPATAKAGE